jgi:hypothetical protein
MSKEVHEPEPRLIAKDGNTVFYNNLGCQKLIDDKIEIIARGLLAEVISKVKYSLNFEEMVNVMVEQGRFSADTAYDVLYIRKKQADFKDNSISGYGGPLQG